MEPISLAFSAIRVAASIGSFLESRKTRKLLQNKQADTLDQHRRDVLLVLGTLGETLLRLGIVDAGAIPAATEDVRRCLELKSPEIREIFDNDLEQPLQYAVATGMVFCAACWPMHIHRGFGCSVLNQDGWNDRWDYSNARTARFVWEDDSTPATTQEPVLRAIDDCIAVLKSSVQRLHLFNKTPSGLSQIEVNLSNCGNEKYKKKARDWLNDVYAEARKRGLPQPKDGSFQVTEMIVGFASWHSNTGYSNIFGKENPYYPVKCQGDPGKLLYAYTVGNQLDLQKGQILMPIDRIQHILITWLNGLEGMTFKLMRDEEFDDKHPKFKKTNRWVFEWNTASTNIVAARDEKQVRKREQSIVQEKSVAQKTTSPPPYSKRGNRKLEVKIAYQARTAEEISINVGDTVEVCDETNPLGVTGWQTWITVRKGNEKGKVLHAHVADAIRTQKAHSDYTATGENDVSIKKGEMVDILADDCADSDLWLVARCGTRLGWIMRLCVETSLKQLEAKFDYTAQEPGELSLKTGDKVEVLAEKKTGKRKMWIHIRADGKIGTVPRLCVEEALRSVSAQVDYTAKASDEQHQELSFRKGDVMDIVHDESSTWCYARKGTNGGYVLQRHIKPPIRTVEARNDYTAKEPDELTFVRGDCLDIIRDEEDSNWLYARKGSTGGQLLRWYIMPPLWVAEAQYNHTAKEDNELSYLKGDVIEIIREYDNNDWVMGIKRMKYGLVAKAYLMRMALRKVKALSKWAAASADELSFKKGDILDILDEREGNAWFIGRKGKKEGLIRKDSVSISTS